MMMWISKLAKAVCFVTGLTWKGGHDEAAAATIYLKDTLTTEEQQQLITCLSKDKKCEAINMSQDDRPIYLPERTRVEALSMTVT
ncbi:unnamed protein product [Brassica rapa subsp. trilocularis]